MKKNTITPAVIDLFCGCGGVTEGLKNSGFRIMAAVDSDPVAAATYRLNHPDVAFIQKDIKRIKAPMLRKIKAKCRRIDLMVVCAPCQPFSSQNASRDRLDGRTHLILEAIRFARILKPRIIFFENVSGLLANTFHPILAKLSRALQRIGYQLGRPMKIDAADYGVPQRRKRCIIIASRHKPIVTIPRATTPKGSRITVRRAFSGLRNLRSGERDSNDALHAARCHSRIALRRLRHIPLNGGSRFSLPASLMLKCHKGRRGHPDVYGRMWWDKVAPTLTTGCTDITRGRFAHPSQDRAITLREAALLQSFPRKYIFYGSRRDVARQIGNAVPVAMIASIGRFLRHQLIEVT